ncbi:MAG: 50S ribosome-binding GTPase, partial [Duncaniella sp.]|nr:50S ribosome-binding GTPase [Duncaniella sp.]
FASRAHLRELAATLLTRISSLAASFSTGTALKDGVPVAIVGEPNAGKSTLLNALLHDDRAIVSNIPGTTRDTIEDTIEIDGVLYRFIDTAGIRETSDSVENLGIGRSYDAISRARIVVWLITPDLSPLDYASLRDTIKQHLSPKTALITVLNKIDLLPEGGSMSENSTIINSDLMTVNDFADESGSDAKKYFVSREDSLTRGDVVSDGSSMFKDNIIKETIDNEGVFLKISAATGENIPALLSMLKDLSGANSVEEADLIVTNARHYESLVHAKSSLERVIDGIDSNLSGDFIAQDLRETIHHLSTITGTITTTDLLKTIFERFCIGK